MPIDKLGHVESLDRQARWRPGWDAVVNRDGERLSLYVRGSKGETTYFWPVDMYHEYAIHQAFQATGIPAPRVYGMMDDPDALVMEKLPGRINTGAIEIGRAHVCTPG